MEMRNSHRMNKDPLQPHQQLKSSPEQKMLLRFEFKDLCLLLLFTIFSYSLLGSSLQLCKGTGASHFTGKPDFST